MARALADNDTSAADEVLRANSEAFFYKLDDMEFKLRNATKALLQDNEKYILCLETPETSLMSALLAKTLRNLKIEGFSNQHQDQIFTDFQNAIKFNKHHYENWTNFPDLLVCIVGIDEELEKHSELLTSWAKLVKDKSKNIIFIMNNSKYLEQSMMKTRIVNVLKLKFPELWEEYDRKSNCYDNKVGHNQENYIKQSINDVLNNAVSKAVNEAMKNVKTKEETSEKSALPTEEEIMKLTTILKLQGVDSMSAVDNEGNTPLHLAAKNGQNKIVKGLLVCDASMESKNYDGYTPLHLATEGRHHKVVSTLLENGAQANAIAARYSKETPLHMACSNYNNDVRSIVLLLKFGANIETKDANSSTPLHLAIEKGHHEVVSTLLENNANVNAVHSNRGTPLHMACYNNDIRSIIVLLLKFGAKIETKDDEGHTPLHTASSYGHNTVVTTLLEHGSNINAQDDDGCTPLHLAIKTNNQHVVINLLQNGADPNLKNNSKQTAVDCARSSWDAKDLILLIKKHAASANK